MHVWRAETLHLLGLQNGVHLVSQLAEILFKHLLNAVRDYFTVSIIWLLE